MPLADPADALRAQAMMGTRLEEFLRTDVGRYLVSQAEGEEKNAIEALLAAEDGSPESRAARMRIEVVRLFGGWLADGINAGIAAMVNLRQSEEYQSDDYDIDGDDDYGE